MPSPATVLRSVSGALLALGALSISYSLLTVETGAVIRVIVGWAVLISAGLAARRWPRWSGPLPLYWACALTLILLIDVLWFRPQTNVIAVLSTSVGLMALSVLGSSKNVAKTDQRRA
ncbi:hypothetical protein QR90_08840 [Deinococcus radiopugnans]|uniref:Uncharacterized protein n=1 Tax=Deinococcus radiopugnans TaxID=57497 RepID=A0A0A7KGF3_9DEIO|nr:hypothetical protein [Deinococcus radiopugnans]AIZ45185.1 hypothetical protein QR90_08840 [Deinococcus radiopugnans]